MVTWIGKTLSSSIGKKYVMALSGLALIGFLVVHLAGNLQLYLDPQGLAFDEYERMLSANPLLIVAEIGLFALFAIHVFYALKLSVQNREARRERYAIRATRGERTIASASTLITGVALLVFLVIHVWDFRIAKMSAEEGFSLAGIVRARLERPVGAGIYLLSMIALALHLSHGFQSAFHTLGLKHPRVNPLIQKVSIGLAILLALGFASFPIYFLFTRGAR
jgi:succinate dehydrogenase / fumarate reductase, cytochrome b subunit